jgi:hypothetical protein
MSVRGILAGVAVAGLVQLALTAAVASDVPKGPYVAVEGDLAWTASVSHSIPAAFPTTP